MLSRTITVNAKPDATESEYARDTAVGIKALLLSTTEEVQILAITMVFAGLAPEVQNRIRTMLGLVVELKAQTRA